jgi:hypothetical protein
LAAVDFFFETWQKRLKEKPNKGENKWSLDSQD